MPSSTLITPSLLFWTLLGATVFFTWLGYKKGKAFKGIDVGIFSVTGLMGVFLTLLWFATNHKAAAGNLNLIWAFPGHVLLVVAILRNSNHLFWQIYNKITAMGMMLLLVLWPVLPQMLHYSLIPIVLIIGIRAGLRGWQILQHVEVPERVNA